LFWSLESLLPKPFMNLVASCYRMYKVSMHDCEEIWIIRTCNSDRAVSSPRTWL
jgi:hypothetical protein